MEKQIYTGQNKKDNGIFGFWIYLMTDLLMFAVLFAAYAVLHNNTYGAASIHHIFNPLFLLTETVILLTSSFTCGLGLLSVEGKNKNRALLSFFLTFLLGLSFVIMELYEFINLFLEGNSFQKSAFLSSYFTLVGTHGLHIFVGLLWLSILLIHMKMKGLNENNMGKLKLFSLFWHFLDIVWIFIFTMVYLMGAVS